jgi:P-type Cu+ transporter
LSVPTATRTTLLVSGMHCAGCVGSVERALKDVPGVEECYVNLATSEAVVSHGADVEPQALGEAIRAAGSAMTTSTTGWPCKASGIWAWAIPRSNHAKHA